MSSPWNVRMRLLRSDFTSCNKRDSTGICFYSPHHYLQRSPAARKNCPGGWRLSSSTGLGGLDLIQSKQQIFVISGLRQSFQGELCIVVTKLGILFTIRSTKVVFTFLQQIQRCFHCDYDDHPPPPPFDVSELLTRTN
jgi:hypothetical protein